MKENKPKLEILIEGGFVDIVEEGSTEYLATIDANPIFFSNEYSYYVRHPQPESSRCIVYRIKRRGYN